MEWITKQYYRRRNCLHDVNVSVNGNNKDKHGYRTSFAFRNNCHKKVSINDYIVIGFTGTRVYFKNAPKETGFHLFSRNKDGGTVYRVAITGKYDGFIGDYDLLFDNENGLWYIDSELKK